MRHGLALWPCSPLSVDAVRFGPATQLVGVLTEAACGLGELACVHPERRRMRATATACHHLSAEDRAQLVSIARGICVPKNPVLAGRQHKHIIDFRLSLLCRLCHPEASGNCCGIAACGRTNPRRRVGGRGEGQPLLAADCPIRPHDTQRLTFSRAETVAGNMCSARSRARPTHSLV